MNLHEFDIDFYEDEMEHNNESYKYLVLVIYDIVQNKTRNKIVDILKGYGKRVQKSSFECIINERQLKSLITLCKSKIDFDTDSLRVYKLSGSAELYTYGIDVKIYNNDVFIL